MENDQESIHFWSSLLQSPADTNCKDGLYPDSPMMVMSTSMAINVMKEPWKAKEAGLEKSTDEKEMEKWDELIDNAKEEKSNLGKKRSNKTRNIAEKKRRTDIKTKIELLKQMTHSNAKKDLCSALESIVDQIRQMKFYVESHSMGLMMPLGMGMDFPAPWFPFIPPSFIMPFNSSHGHHEYIVPITTKGLNNQPQSSKSM